MYLHNNYNNNVINYTHNTLCVIRRHLETEESNRWLGTAVGETSQRGRAPAVVRGRSRFHSDAGRLGSIHGPRHHGHGAE